MNELPTASSCYAELDVESVKRKVLNRQLVGLANNTKWDELIHYVRELPNGSRPEYRSKYVNGYISNWDLEWFYHLPFPFIGVEWFDMEYSKTDTEPLFDALVAQVARIGLEFEVFGKIIRVFGYAPKSYEALPANA